MELILPLKKWMIDALENRENDKMSNNKKMPFIIATSISKVVQSGATYTNAKTAEEKYKTVLNDTIHKNIYYGCVLSNNVDPKLSYSSNTTNIGYDLMGKLIVANEIGRKIPTPIITSFEIDTDGRSNALKSGILSVKCFSLKQYEMFEQFYCKLGMYILVEFGDNTFVDSGVSINKTDYSEFVKEYKKLIDYNSNPDLYFKYLGDIQSANGAYDRFVGLVNNYQFSIAEDGTYNITIKLIQTNQISLSVPNVYVNNGVDIATPNNSGLNTFGEWFAQLKSDLRLDSNFELIETEWKNDFFNWGKVNLTKPDENASNEPYITLKLALNLLNHNMKNEYVNKDMFKFQLPKYEVAGKLEEIIPIRIHKNLLSKDDSILFPTSELIQFDVLDNRIGIVDKTIDGTINGKNVLENRDIRFEYEKGKFVNIKQKGDYRVGNALNIFIRYRDVAELWNKTINKIDYLNALLNKLNDLGYGFYYLVYGNIRENQYSSVVDLNLYSETQIPERNYRFKANTMNSIVRNLSFTFEPSKNQASYTIYNQDLQIYNSVKNATNPKEEAKELLLPAEFFEETRLYLNMNADGYYSINQISFEYEKEAAEKASKNVSYKPTVSNTKPNDEIRKELYTKINNYSKIFKTGNKEYRTLVFSNESLILEKLASTINRDNSSVTPIDITLTIDGISGFSCGEYFYVDGVPEIYNILGSFRVVNVMHSITDENGWLTTLVCKWWINN